MKTSILRLPSVLFVFATLIFAGMLPVAVLHAQTSVLDGPAFSATPRDLLAASAGVPKQANADAIVFVEEQHYSIDERGRASQRRHLIYRVDTANGVENWASVSSTYRPWFQNKPSIRARVVTPDGVQHDLDLKTLTDTAEGEQSPNVYSDERSYEGPLPAIEIGAIVETEVSIQDTAPFFEGSWSTRYTFGYAVPVLKTRLQVEAPSLLPVRYVARLLPDLKARKSEVNGKTTLLFEQGRLEGQKAERLLPPDVPRYPYVALTTAVKWQDLAEQYRKRTEPQIRPAEVKSLVAGFKAGDDATLAQILAKVHANARYTGLEFGEANLTPQPPSETLKRKYGDCKDKATLLVSMLRAAGIPAYLALLKSGGLDVEAELPGMNSFNHAIAYLPEKDLFIDATAEYYRVGELPSADQGRWALIISEGSTGLKRTPELPSSASRTVEKRDFFLSEYGPARVVETTESYGDREASYRSSYDGSVNEEFKKHLDGYAEEMYLADAVSKYEFTDVRDLRKHFTLRLEIAEAKRGSTGLNDAVAAIRLIDLVNGRIPEDLRQEEKQPAGKDDSSSADYAERSKPRTADWYLEEVYQAEWRYNIVPPPGFRVRLVPESKTTHFGPAVFTQEYRATQDGRIEALLRFDLTKRRYSVAEAAELRGALKQFGEQGVVFIYFDLAANTQLQQGQVREALAEFRKLTAMHPKEGLHKAQLARAYLAVSLGDAARAEARQAVQLDPKSAVAWATLGEVLQHDLVGRRFKRAFDPNGAAEALRKAKELDPKETNYSLMLGETLEFDNGGERYTSGARLDEAIAVYQEMRKNKDADANQMNEHLVYALAYAHRFAELRDTLSQLGTKPLFNAMRLLAIAGLEGGAAAVRKSAEITNDEKSRSDALATAGTVAMRARMYPEAAQMLAVAASGQANASEMANLARTLSRVRKHEEMPTNPADPVNTVLRAFIASNYSDRRGQVLAMMSRAVHELPGEAAREIVRQHWSNRFNAGLPEKVMLDLTISLLKASVEGDAVTGYRVSLQVPGMQTQHVYLLIEGEALKILGETEEMGPLGQEALDRVRRGDLKGAKILLDWARDDRKLAGGEDPYAGSAFPRLWSKGQELDAARMQVAAFSLLFSVDGAAAPWIPQIEALQEKTANDAERAKIDEALMQAYLNVKDWPKVEQAAGRLLARTESSAVFSLLASSLTRQHKWDNLARLIQQHKDKLNDEVAAPMVEAEGLIVQGQPLKAAEVLKKLIDSGKGDEGAINNYGWAGVIARDIKPEAIEIVQQAAQQPKNQDYALLHTLGCMYAEAQRTAQARQVLFAAMDNDKSVDEPQSNIWFGFGLLAEGYGETEAAARLYRKVEKPRYYEMEEQSTWSLAQHHLAGIEKKLK